MSTKRKAYKSRDEQRESIVKSDIYKAGGWWRSYDAVKLTGLTSSGATNFLEMMVKDGYLISRVVRGKGKTYNEYRKSSTSSNKVPFRANMRESWGRVYGQWSNT